MGEALPASAGSMTRPNWPSYSAGGSGYTFQPARSYGGGSYGGGYGGSYGGGLVVAIVAVVVVLLVDVHPVVAHTLPTLQLYQAMGAVAIVVAGQGVAVDITLSSQLGESPP